MSKKKLIPLLIVAVLVVGLSIAVVLLTREQPEDSTTELSAVEKIYLLGGPLGKHVSQLTVNGPDGSYTIQNLSPPNTPQADKPSPEAVIQELGQAPQNESQLRGALETAGALEAKSQVGQGNLATYGLENPAVTVDITYGDDTTARLLLGHQAPGGEGTYVAVEGSDTVYLVANQSLTPYGMAKMEYADLTIVPPTENPYDFNQLTLSGENFPQPIVIQARPEDATEMGGMVFNTHRIVQPIQSGLDSQRGLEPLQTLFGLTASAAVEVVEDAQQLAAFGLDQPAAKVELHSTSDGLASFVLLVSQPQPNGNYLVWKEGGHYLYEVSPSALPWMSLALFDFSEKMPLLPFIDSVSTVTVKTGDKTYVFALTGEEDDLSVELDGKPLDVQQFKKYYQVLLSASFTEPGDAEPQGEPLLQFTYGYRDSAKASDSIAFYPLDARRVIMAVNGDQTVHLAKSTYVDKVAQVTQKLLAGEAIDAFA